MATANTKRINKLAIYRVVKDGEETCFKTYFYPNLNFLEQGEGKKRATIHVNFPMKITREMFDTYLQELLSGSPIVIGATIIDMEAQDFSILDQQRKWHHYGINACTIMVSNAIEWRFRDTVKHLTIDVFRPSRYELTPVHAFPIDNIEFKPDFIIVDNDLALQVKLTVDPKVAFGIDIPAFAPPCKINAYAGYDKETDSVCPQLQVNYFDGDGILQTRACLLGNDEMILLTKKMNTFCLETTGRSLPYCCAKRLTQLSQNRPASSKEKVRE